MKYTKGKWAWQKFGQHYLLAAQHGSREIIIGANCLRGGSYPSMNNDGILRAINPDHPNAKLISKAPEMYKALKWFINSMEDGSLQVYTDDDQHKAVRDDNNDNINKIYSLIKEME